MLNSSEIPTCALPPHLAAWRSLVSRSIAEWDKIPTNEQPKTKHLPKDMLEKCHSLDDFLVQCVDGLMLWFFQQRSAFMTQKQMQKWSRDKLDDYILLPALNGFVSRLESFFVSHFWRTPEHPDPDGQYLRLHQAELKSQTWLYIWVDWTCMPQSPRSLPEEAYFRRCLGTVSGIIRNCGFIYFYPPFEPRLWILFEITEYVLTCDEGLEKSKTPDIQQFLQHIDEMIETGVQATLTKHNYRCSFDRDRQFLTSWLELLILLRRLQFDTDVIRRIMDHMTWFHVSGVQRYPSVGMELNRFEGTLLLHGNLHRFTPFPKWIDGKYG